MRDTTSMGEDYDYSEEENQGWCGSFGEQLYDAGTETCDFCPMSEPCFQLYEDWMKRTRGGATV